MATQYPGDKDKAPSQSDFDASWKKMKEGEIPLPQDQDYGPLPTKEPKKETVKPAKKMAKGGSASSRADGIAVKGKTKGRYL